VLILQKKDEKAALGKLTKIALSVGSEKIFCQGYASLN